MQFTYGGSVDYHEAFYVAEGSGRRQFADGSAVPMTTGDLIYVRPGVEITYTHGPGFLDIAFFWTDQALGPAIAPGLTKAEVTS